MGSAELNQGNVLRLALAKGDGPSLDQIVSSLVSGVGQLEEENRSLKERNLALESSLNQASQRISVLEEAMRTNAEAAKHALHATAQTLSWSEEAVGIGQNTGSGEPKRHLDAAKRVLELQKEVVTLLEKAQAEIVRRDHEASQRAVHALREARASLLAAAEGIAAVAPESASPPSRNGVASVTLVEAL